MFKTWWPAAVALPLVACVAVFWLAEGPRDWTSLPRSVISGTFSGALLLNAFLSILLAPLLGVAVANRTRTAGRIALDLGALIATFAVTSALLSLAGWGFAEGAATAAASSHLAMAAGAMALGAFGALCARIFPEPLDAAAVSVSTALLLGTGILLAGPYVTDAPKLLIDGTLLASPLVTTAAAADIDILRTDVFYQVSPLARVGAEYADWYVATAVYFLATAACLSGVALVNRKSNPRWTD